MGFSFALVRATGVLALLLAFGAAPASAAPSEPTTTAASTTTTAPGLPTTLPHIGDLAVSVAGPPRCWATDGRRLCELSFVVANNGPDDYWDPIDITYTLPVGLAACVSHGQSAGDPAGSCNPVSDVPAGQVVFGVLPPLPIQGWQHVVGLDTTEVPVGTVLTVTMAITAPLDPVPANNAATASVTVAAIEPSASSGPAEPDDLPGTGGAVGPLLAVAALAGVIGLAAWRAAGRP